MTPRHFEKFRHPKPTVRKAKKPLSPKQMLAVARRRVAQNQTQWDVIEAVTDRLPHLLDCAWERGAWVWLVALPMRMTDADRKTLREIGFRREPRRDQQGGECWQHKCGLWRGFDKQGNPFSRYGGDCLASQFSFGHNAYPKTAALTGRQGGVL